jgi:hypothetical protein
VCHATRDLSVGVKRDAWILLTSSFSIELDELEAFWSGDFQFDQ